jgi:predicted transposase YbfD/YdcC
MKHKISYYLEGVKDHRVVARCAHLLSDILIVAICTYVTGGTDFKDMYLFCKERGEQLKGSLLVLTNGTPSVDTFERVFKHLDVEALRNCLCTFGREILDCLAEKQIVLDGKKLKGVSPTSKGNSGCYILNAWVSENRFCVGQEKVADKSNEITAIPKVLNSLDIEDSVVTIDAMGTQTAIAAQIREKKGNYLLSVKANQKGLLEDVESAFKVNHGHDTMEETEKGHGRIETRQCSILPAKDFLLDENLKAWKDVATLVKIDASREIKGVRKEETRYYISNEKIQKAAYYNALVRGHWGIVRLRSLTIENHLHWHLDVTFKEDMCRARAGNAPENLATLRKFALQILTNVKDNLSLKKRQYKAALDMEYMKKILLI